MRDRVGAALVVALAVVGVAASAAMFFVAVTRCAGHRPSAALFAGLGLGEAAAAVVLVSAWWPRGPRKTSSS
jgi:hypothetical protein